MNKIKIIIQKTKEVFSITFRNYMRVTKIIWENDKWLLLLSYFRSIINSITPIINAFIYGEIVNILIQGVDKKANISFPLTILFLIWFILYFISNYIGTLSYIIWQKVNLLINTIYVELVLDKMNNVGIKTLYNKEFYDYFDKTQERYNYAGAQVANNAFRLNTGILSFIFSIAVFFYFSPLIAVLVILALIPSIVYEINYSDMSWGIWDDSSELRKKYYALINIFRRKNSEELKIHDTGDYLKDKVIDLNKEKYKKEMSLAKNRTQFNIFGSLMDTLIYILSTAYIVYKAMTKIIPVGSVVTFVSILANYISSVQFVTSSFTDVYMQSLYLEDIYKYLEFHLEDEIVSGDKILENNKLHKIEFRDVYFKYPDTDKYIFNGLNLTINPGEKVAIVGENGAGKSTFINLLCRFYDPDKGDILIDDINIKQINTLSWYNNIGVLFQDYIKYQFSIKENIYLGKINKKDKNLKTLINSAKKGGSHKFIQKLKDQYETDLGEQENDLSGGQWQKLALSREFFRDPNILVLDEPTSNLDAKSEDEIFKIIESSAKDKTVILISHRFSTVRNANKIFVFEMGKILEQGTHKELMDTKGMYFKLFSLQAKGYK